MLPMKICIPTTTVALMSSAVNSRSPDASPTPATYASPAPATAANSRPPEPISGNSRLINRPVAPG